MNNSAVLIFLLFSFIVSSVSEWQSRSKRLLLLPELSLHYKSVFNRFKTVEQRAIKDTQNFNKKDSSSVMRTDDQRKREIRMSKPSAPTSTEDKMTLLDREQTKSIRHPCYFSPIQCLLTIPEDQMRTFVKTHNGVQNIEGRHISLPQRNRVMSRLKQHDDRHNLFGTGLFRLSPYEKF